MIERIEELLAGVTTGIAGVLDDLEERLTTRIDTLAEFIDERMTRIMALQDDINAALAGDEAALTALGERVQVTIDAGVKIKTELDTANAEIATLKAANPQVDAVALQESLKRIKDHANSIDAPAPSSPGPPAPGPTQPGGPQPAGSKPLYTFTGTPPADASWTLTDLLTTDNKDLYTFNADTSGGPATGDGLGGVWHLYAGNVVQESASSPPPTASGGAVASGGLGTGAPSGGAPPLV